MDIVDLIITIIIFLIFSLVSFFNFYFTGIQSIRDGWETEGYKCNPLIIPFTGTIWAGTSEAEAEGIAGHTKRSAQGNFTDCVGKLTAGNLEILLQPITTQLGLGTTTNTGSILPNLSTGSSLNNLTNQQKIDILFKN